MDVLFMVIVLFLLVVVLAMQFQITQLSKKVDDLIRPPKARW